MVAEAATDTEENASRDEQIFGSPVRREPQFP